MAGETVITIIGNLTADPELRTLSSGATVAGFTIASTPRNWNRQTNQFEDGQALFMRCSAWRDVAEHCAQTLAKGMRVIAQGRLQQRSYQAQDGSNRTVMELQVDDIGPSLRYAKAAVVKTSINGGNRQGGYSGGQPAYQGGGSGFTASDPFNGAQPAPSGQQSWEQPQSPEGDPWAQASPAEPADFGGTGGEPEF